MLPNIIQSLLGRKKKEQEPIWVPVPHIPNRHENLIGKRIRMIEMVDDPDPIPYGSDGLVVYHGGGILNVQWDNGRTLGVGQFIDKYQIL